MGKGLSIAGFILSLVGLLCSFIFFYLSIPCAVTGLVLSVIGGKKLKANNMPHGLATAGMILGIISLSFATLMTACGICAVCAVQEIASEIAGAL